MPISFFSRVNRRFSLTSIAVVSFSLASSAMAQSDPHKEESKRYFDEGIALDSAQRRLEALEKFRKAYSLYPSPNVLYNVAREEHLLSKYAEALRDYRGALRNPLLTAHNREIAQKYISELEQQVGQIRITAPAGTTLLVDGIPTTLGPDPVPAMPGKHHIEAQSGARAEAHDVQVAKAQIVPVELFASASPPASSSGPSSGATTAPSSASASAEPPPLIPGGGILVPEGEPHTMRSVVVPLILGGVAVVAFGTAVGFSIDSSSKSDDIDQARAAFVCSAGRQTASCQAAQDTLDAQSRSATIAAVSYGISAAALLGGLIVYFTAPPSSSRSVASRASFAPIVSPGRSTAGASVGLSF